MLLVLENVLSSEQVQQFQQNWTRQQWQPGFLSAGSQAKKVKNNLQLDDSDPLAENTREAILDALIKNADFLSAAIPKSIYPPKFNCYQDGGYYGIHVDNAILTLPSGQPMRTDLSATIFLSEPDCYDGGELMIETTYGTQEIKLTAGDMVLYPSTSLHQVAPVTRGARLAAFFWIESLVQDNQNRALLYDLDQSIQALTINKPNEIVEQEINRLTGIYHNLVRLWAEA